MTRTMSTVELCDVPARIVRPLLGETHKAAQGAQMQLTSYLIGNKLVGAKNHLYYLFFCWNTCYFGPSGGILANHLVPLLQQNYIISQDIPKAKWQTISKSKDNNLEIQRI